MCGINGVLINKQNAKTEISEILFRMNQSIIHRGPDGEGFFVKKDNIFEVGMGMRRLSIIDLKTGDQPLYSEDGTVSIVFNGEIYNYRLLKKSLQKKGVLFKTTSDTEVILRLYEELGTDAFAMLDGMFAFSIYDDKLKKVFIGRDFFGEKPLYFTQKNKEFYWASELKSIISVIEHQPKISKNGLNLYFQLTYIPAPFTIYENIYKLEANHLLELDCKECSYTIKEISQKTDQTVDPKISFEEAKFRTRSLVNESVKSRSIADVNLGTFLSGGVDSSIVSLSLARQSDVPIDTFSIGFEKKSFDESDKSRTVAKIIKSKHQEYIISVKDLQNNIPEILLNFDEPFADSSSLPTYLVAHKTRQQVKVALTGDGGDEVFGGYNKYYMGKLNNKYISLLPESLHVKLKSFSAPFLTSSDDKRGKRFKIRKLLSAINYEGDFYYNIISLGFQHEELSNILQDDKLISNSFEYYKRKVAVSDKPLTYFRNIDKIISLEGDMLVKVDRTSMLTSLESRAPFLNKELWNFTAQLPESYLIKGWNKKYLLKEAYKEYFPEGFLDKSKKGFGIPVGDWLRDYLSEELKAYISPNFLKSQNIFKSNEITALVLNHLSGKEDNTFRVWTFYCFQKWYKEIYSV